MSTVSSASPSKALPPESIFSPTMAELQGPQAVQKQVANGNAAASNNQKNGASTKVVRSCTSRFLLHEI